VDPSQNHFGTDGLSSFEGESQEFKIPHLRNLYQKVGMFGFPGTGATGPQVRGFGFLHDGSVDTVFTFLHAAVFNFANDTERRQVESFVLAMDSDLAPVVGQQVTLTSANNGLGPVTARLNLFDQRMDQGECEVIVKGQVGGLQRGWIRQPGGLFHSDRVNDPLLNNLTDTQLRAFTNTVGQDLTFTAVPVGSGERMGIDRDEDGALDRDEIDAGSDPADPLSIPPTPTPTPTGAATGTATATATATATPTATPSVPGIVLVSAKKILIKNKLPDDESKNKIVLLSGSASIVAPAPGSGGDPRCNSDPSGTVKATLTVTGLGSSQSHSTGLPCQNWQLIGSAAHPKGYKYSDSQLTAGTVKTLVWKDQKQLKATLLGKGPTVLNYDLQVGVSQEPVAVRFAYPGSSICMGCTGFNGKDGSDGKEFLGKECPPPGSCPP
jgi:hypothetical protein